MSLVKFDGEIILSYLISIIIYLTGGFDKIFIGLIIFMILDYITGIMKAIKNKKLSSRVGFTGLARKFLILSIVCVSNIVDKTLNADAIIRNCIIMFYICNEGISILENASYFNVPFPEKLKSALEEINKRGEN